MYSYRRHSRVFVLLIVAAATLLMGCTDPQIRKQEHYEKGIAFHEAGEIRKAVLELRNAVQIDPDFVDARYYLGLCFLKQQNFAAAAAELKKVQTAKPDMIEIKRYLAEALVGAGEFKDCRSICEESIAAHPESAAIYDLLSQALMGLSNAERKDDENKAQTLLEDAVRNAEKAITLDPELVEPHITLARALIIKNQNAVPPQHLKESDEAIVRAHFESVKKKVPDNLPTLRRLAGLWFWASYPTEAMKEIEAALKIDPDDAEARLIKAELLFNDREVEAAQTIAETLVEEKIRNLRIDFLLGRIWFSKGEIEEARTAFESLKNTVDGGYFYAVCLERLGNREQSIQQFKSVLDTEPSHEGARRALFELYLRNGDLDRAALEADQVASMAPSGSVQFILRSRLAMARQDWDAAGVAVEEALKLDPRSTEALLIRAQIYVNQGQKDSALSSLGELISLRPDTATAYQARSDLHLRMGSFDQAEEDARFATTLVPRDARPHVAIARARLGKKDVPGAIDAFQQALELAPDDTQTRLAFAALYESEKDYDRALETLETVSEDDVLFVHARSRIAEIYEAKGDPETAAAEFKSLLATHPHVADATTGLFKHYWRLAAFDEAEQVAKEAIEKDPTDPLGHRMLSDFYASKRLWDRAADEMKAAANLWPDSSRLQFKLGQLSASAMRFQDALYAYQEAVGLEPDFDAAALGAARVLVRLGRTDEAVGECARVLERNPKDLNAQVVMADIKMVQGKTSEAEKMYREAIKADEGLLLPYLHLAALYERDGRMAGAQQVFETALGATPLIPELYVEYGRLWERQGDKERARQQYAKALELSPEDRVIIDIFAKMSADTGHFDVAEKQLRTRIEQQPQDLSARLNLALVLERQGKTDEATKSLLDFVTASEDPDAIGMALGRAFASMRRYDEIERLAKGLLSADFENWMAHYVLGLASAGKGESEIAREHFAKAAQLNRETPLPQHAMGAMYATMNKLDDALKAFEVARGIDERFMPAYTDATSIHLRQDAFDKAEALCDRALRANPHASRAAILKAIAQVRSGRTERALSTVYDLIEKAPDQAIPASSVAESLSLEGDHDAAIELCKRCMATAPSIPGLIMRLGNVYELAGKNDLAAGEYRRLISLVPSSAPAHNNLAWMLAQEDKLDEALTHAERARELSPDYPAFLDTLGWIHYMRGDAAEAIPLLEAAAKGASHIPEILYHLAKAYAEIGRNGDAQPLLEKALRADTEFSEADDARAVLNGIAAEAGQ